MGACAMYALAALLACLCLTVAAIPTEPTTAKPHRRSVHIPNGKVYVYKYSAVVSAGQDEPAPFASKFQIQGKLLHKHDDSDPDLKSKEVKYMKFHDIKHTIFNGPNAEGLHGEYQTLDDDVKDFEEPILVVYDDYNRLQGVKIQGHEAIWSKNMKKSLASIMQMDFQRFELQENMQPMAFQTKEKTIHGECLVQYNVYTEIRDGKKFYYVHKAYEPKSCRKYAQYVATDANTMDCKAEMEVDLVTSAERIYEFEYVNDKDFLVKKIIAHEKLSFLPWQHRSPGIQYITTNQTIEFEKVMNESELKLPVVDFKSVTVDDVTFDYEQSEVEFSRYYVDQKILKEKTQELLVKVMDYLKANPIDVKDSEHKFALEKLQRLLVHLDSETLRYIYNHFNQNSEKGNMTRKIFLEMVPHIGTFAAWNFTKQVISDKALDEETAINMLSTLPLYILNPTEAFVKEMSDFKYFDLSKSIKKAGILSYSILLHKTYKGVGENVPEFLESELKYFYERIKYEATYLFKIVYIMALKNIEVGNIYKYLAPIVRGEDVFFVQVDIEKPEKYRTAAMWAVAKSISHNKEQTFNLFWPILSNKTEPLSMRLTAYELLVSRNPMLDMNLLMNVHWLMTEEHDEHMFSYHYTTMKNMAESTNPCMKTISEMMRKVLRLTKDRKMLSTAISLSNVYDYYDTKYGHGRMFKVAIGIDENSSSHFGHFEMISIFARQPRHTSAFHWNLDGVNFNTIMEFILPEGKNGIRIPDKKIQDLLSQTYSHKLFNKKIHVEYWSLNKGYVTDVHVFFENGLIEFVKQYVKSITPETIMESGYDFNRHIFNIDFANRYKMIVATDIGIPAIFYGEIPYLSSMKLKSNISPYATKLQLEFEMRSYYHSFYRMKFYNPLADVTHSVMRSITTDMALPIDMTVSLDLETFSMKIVLPRMPETKMSVAGIKRYAVDQVKVGKDFKRVLKLYCSTCNPLVDITKDQMYKTKYENVKHSMDTGLEYKYTVFNCDDRYVSNTESEEWFRILNMKPNNAENNVGFAIIMAVDMGWTNFLNVPYISNCGTMMKVSPCTTHPSSRVEINGRFNAEKLADGARLNLRGSIDTSSASTNKTMRYWDVDTNIDVHNFFSELNLQLTRHTPGEKNLKICIDYKKAFPNMITNATVEQETNSKITFTMGYSNDDKCIHDSTLIAATIKGELSSEQVDQMKKYVDSGSCFKNPSNPLDWDITQRFDWNCIYHAVEATTLRKYSIDVLYKQIPNEMIATFAAIDDFLRQDILPSMSYRADHTEEGNMKIFYTQLIDIANVTVINPFYTYEYTVKKQDHDDLILDNTGYSLSFLNAFYSGNIRPCIANPKHMINDLNQTQPMNFKDWTLMYGDYNWMSLAVFVKTVDDDKIAMKIYSKENILEVQPGKSKPVIIFDGTVVDDESKLPFLGEKSWLKASMIYDILNVDIEKFVKMKVLYSPRNVVMMPQRDLSSHVDGVCGHMGSTIYTQQVPLVCSSC